MRRLLPLVVVASACSPVGPPVVEQPIPLGEVNGIAACDTATIEQHPDKRCRTYRGLGGVSMGGGTASRLGFTHPDLYDVVGIMGTPLTDNEMFFGMLETNHLAGFCSLDALEQLVADGVDLDDDDDARVFCGQHDSWPMEGDAQVGTVWPAAPDTECFAFKSDYNHWYRGPEEGRGGTFGRNGLIEVIHDLVAAFGNSLTYDEAQAYLPPGVPDDWRVPPGLTNEERAAFNAERCANPVRIPGVFNAEFNPEGTYDAITFCDGRGGPKETAGIFDPDDSEARSRVVEFALAVDLDGDGIRDYGEPIIVNNRERWRDHGEDGVPSVLEDGYDAATNPDPAGDDFDPGTNATGTERNLRRDEGEEFDDFGLDGVDQTGDFGEGNGDYDISPNLQRMFDRSPAKFFSAMPESQVRRLDIWMDAGIRDFLNSAQISNALFSEMKKRIPNAQAYDDFPSLPGAMPGEFTFYDADYSRAAMGQLAYLRYGDPATCPSSDDILGDGNHVGPDVVDRLLTLFAFLSARIPAEGRDTAIGGDISDLESPNGELADFGFMAEYDSEVLGHAQPYGIVLPPDYFIAERQENRYPVLYFFHGQGQDAHGMVLAGLILWGFMKESSRPDRIDEGKTDLQRAILVFVDGECHGDECFTGNFYADFEGLPRDDRNFEDAFYELVRHVDSTYRTKPPQLVDE
jgi:hypothetical protein